MNAPVLESRRLPRGHPLFRFPPFSFMCDYWPWLLLALALHLWVFFGLNRVMVQKPSYTIDEGRNVSTIDVIPISGTTVETPSVSPPEPAPVPPVSSHDEMTLPAVTPSPLPAPRPVVSQLPPMPHRQVSHKSRPPPANKTTHHTESRENVTAGRTDNARPGYLHNPAPPYPEEARESGQEGVVHLMVHVNERGRVTGILLVKSSGHPLLDRQAMDTVRDEWTFKPATAGGMPVSSQVQIPVRFKLSD